MSALALEEKMAVDNQVAKLESGIADLRSDAAEIRSDVGCLRTEVVEIRSDVGRLRSEVAEIRSDVGHLHSDVAEIKGDLKRMTAFQTEVAKEFGSIRVQLERDKLWILATGATTILSVLGSAAALVRLLKP